MDPSDFGSGPPLVLIPGLDGRREFVRPAADALARSFRVLALSLCGERASGVRFDPADRNSILVRRYVEGQAAAAATKAH